MARIEELGESCTAMLLKSVTAAVTRTFGLALLRARTVTWLGVGRLGGAMYMVWSGSLGELVTVPTVWSPPTTPLTSQVTLVSGTPLTVALKGCERPSSTLAEVGETLIEMTTLMATATAAALVGSAAGVAVMLTVLGDGAATGAV